MSVPEFLQPWLGSNSSIFQLLLAGVGLLVVGFLVGLWQLFGRGPRRRRAGRHAQKLLHQKDWEKALAEVARARALGRGSQAWQGRLRNIEGECHRQAGDQALEEKHFEASLEHYTTAAKLLAIDRNRYQQQVLEGMLAETRRLFASSTGKDIEAIVALVSRIQALEPDHAEALFWLALCQVREGGLDRAAATLTRAHEAGRKQFIDPPLYLGALLLKQNRPAEALRVLPDANRIDSNCPFVAWQLGTAIVAACRAEDEHGTREKSRAEPSPPADEAGTRENAGTREKSRAEPSPPADEAGTRENAGTREKGMLAVRALKRVLGPRGLTQWLKTPARAWIEGLPDRNRSFIQRLASQHTFNCPLLGSDVKVMVRQAQLALAQVQYRLGNYQEAADVYQELLRESAPSVTVLRGLGLSLSRLERYDEAFKHLRIAHEMEDPKDPLTAGYLALCGARGKPSRPEDKPSNVAWAVRQLARYGVSGDPVPAGGRGRHTREKPEDEAGTREKTEWARISSAIFAEARSIDLSLPLEDHLRHCDLLVSVHATDPLAAASYDHLARVFPDGVGDAHAWHYCLAAEQHGFRGNCDLNLFTRVFASPDHRAQVTPAMEYLYLERWAAARPGRLPDGLGPDQEARIEELLLEYSRQQEQAGHPEQARTRAEVLLKLIPGNPRAFDRLAYLSSRQGDLEKAASLLADWHAHHPRDPLPLIRRAIVEQQRSQVEARSQAIVQALELSRGPARADIAYLGARLALAAPCRPEDGAGIRERERELAVRWLGECLKENGSHPDALWMLAALRGSTGDTEGLAALAPAMNQPNQPDPRFQYMAAVCHLAAGNLEEAIAAIGRLRKDEGGRMKDEGRTAGVILPPSSFRLPNAEGQYLLGLAHLYRHETDAAVPPLTLVAQETGLPSADHARAWLGRLEFGRGDLDEAIRWWNGLDARKRAEWQLDDPLKGTVFLAGLQAYQKGDYELAVDRFREAGRLGWRDRRLGSLLALAHFKSGQHLFYAESWTAGPLTE